MEEGETLDDAAIAEGAKEPEQISGRPEVLEARLKADYMEKGDVSFDIDKDGNLVLFYKGERVFGEGASMPIHFIGVSKNGEGAEVTYSTLDSDEKGSSKKETDNGVVAIIYNRETGEIAFEQKPSNHPDSSVHGKLQPFGGHIEEDETSLEALIRELGEEAAHSVPLLVRAVKERGYKYYMQTAVFGGKVVYTDYWVVPLTNSEWMRFVDGGTTAEAGPLRTLTSWQALSLDNRYYAYGSGPIVKEFIVENIGAKTPYTLIKASSFAPFAYHDSVIAYYKSGQINLNLSQNSTFLRTNPVN